jgi:hypothetical protein
MPRETVVRGGVEPPTFRFSGALSRFKTNNANTSAALLTGVTAGEGHTKTIVATCRGVPRSSASCVGIPWGSPLERGVVGILWASGDCRRKLGQPRVPPWCSRVEAPAITYGNQTRLPMNPL